MKNNWRLVGGHLKGDKWAVQSVPEVLSPL